MRGQRDKNEEFICDISVDGANIDETQARIIIESNDWTLMFNGEVKNGKCIIPIKKLNIYFLQNKKERFFYLDF